MKTRSRNGIEFILENSSYHCNYLGITFYFSSEFYLKKFLSNVENFIKIEENKFQSKYKIKIEMKKFLAIVYYKMVEKRGFYIVDYVGLEKTPNFIIKYYID